MEFYLNLSIFFVGLLLLIVSSKRIVEVAVDLSARFSVSPLLIGATVVAFGTSLPELGVTVSSVFQDSGEISLGNIIGSNIANIGLILGLTILINPVYIGRYNTQKNNLFLIASSLVFILSQLVDESKRLAFPLILLAFSIVFVVSEIFLARKKKIETLEIKSESYKKSGFGIRGITALIFSILAIFLGSQLTVNSSIEIAKYLGVSEEIIGLTMIAVGTSLPELAVSIIAAVKKENKILLGNIIGSNIINITLLGSIVTAFSNVPNGQHKISLLALFLFTLVIFLLTKIYSGKEIPKAFGLILLASYCFYLLILLQY